MRKTLFPIQSVLLFICTLCFLKTGAQPPRAWAAQIPNVNVLAMDVDKKGAVYIIGNFVGTVDFDPGTGVAMATASYNHEFFILKLSRDGNFVWVKQFSANYIGVFYGRSLKYDGASGIYIGGSFNGPFDFDPGPSTFTMGSPMPDYNGFLLKLDTAGNFKWAKELNGWAGINDIAIGESGNVYLTGFYQSSVDFDPDIINSVILSTPGSEQNAFFLKLTHNGDFCWVKTLNGPNRGLGLALACDTLNMTCCFVGRAHNGTDLDPGPGQSISPSLCGYICELDSGGNTLQLKTVRGNCFIESVTYSSGFLVTGLFTDSVDIDPGPALQPWTTEQNTSDGFILKLTDSLTLIWSKEIDGIKYSSIEGQRISIDENKNIFYFARFIGSYDIDPSLAVYTVTSTPTPPPAIPYDYLVAEYDSLFNLKWVHHLGRGSRRTAPGYVTPNGDIYLATSFIGTVDVDPGPLTYTMTSNFPGTAFIERLSTCTGSAVPQLSINASALSVCAGQQLVLNASGAVSYQWAHGPAQSAVGISPTVSTWYEVMGTDSAGCTGFKTVQVTVNNCTGLTETIKTEKVIYPNPTTNWIMVPALPGSKISVCDLSGKQLLSDIEASTGGTDIDLSGLKPGVYLVVSRSELKTETVRVVRQ